MAIRGVAGGAADPAVLSRAERGIRRSRRVARHDRPLEVGALVLTSGASSCATSVLGPLTRGSGRTSTLRAPSPGLRGGRRSPRAGQQRRQRPAAKAGPAGASPGARPRPGWRRERACLHVERVAVRLSSGAPQTSFPGLCSVTRELLHELVGDPAWRVDAAARSRRRRCRARASRRGRRYPSARPRSRPRDESAVAPALASEDHHQIPRDVSARGGSGKSMSSRRGCATEGRRARPDE